MKLDRRAELPEAGTVDDASDSALAVAAANHRIANNLAMIASLVRLSIGHYTRRGGERSAEEIDGLLRDISARIDAAGRLHRRMAANPLQASLEVGSCLRELCEDVQSSVCQPGRVAFDFDLQAGCSVRADRAGPLCLIVTEVLTNAIKYAHPTGVNGRIAVACRQDADGRLLIDVADDGIGLPDGFDPETDGGLGFRLVRLLSQQLGATPRYDSTAIGLRFRLVVPAA